MSSFGFTLSTLFASTLFTGLGVLLFESANKGCGCVVWSAAAVPTVTSRRIIALPRRRGAPLVWFEAFMPPVGLVVRQR